MTAGLLFLRTSALIERRYSSCIRFFHTFSAFPGWATHLTPWFTARLRLAA
jgi:hypothetical protein